ncbi:glycosyltransferase [Leptolyngbya sp. NIES-2104]|uniref:glycosyltransferase n=1 Tax=Leptolyngbya sp. NIES-2104 TaxID=1552121 RepID=UPI0006EC466E|nr:glycosyltransferase [Leptolyngbya sp. NIES-2104]GAP96516.1 glycosyltransferase [Leptolyngbya sp. NIES-2104]
MKLLFLDQTGKSGGAELCLLDIAAAYRESCLVGLFEDGDFRQRLEQRKIPVQVLAQKAIAVRKSSGAIAGLLSLSQLIPLINRVAVLSRQYDAIYANTQKALVVGAIASSISRCPLVYHLHDILSPDHFSNTNRRLAVLMANRAKLVIANSQASRDAFIKAGGNSKLVEVVYNGFDLEPYENEIDTTELRSSLTLENRFIVGHFSRLSPWKGQHVLLKALQYCDPTVCAIFVGDALFGEQEYVQQLKQQVDRLNLHDRVKFLGFRDDVIPLMKLCDVVAHTSTAAEPFGRVIVESMLCGKPTIAAKAGAAIELIDPEVTGWLTTPNDPKELANAIELCRQLHTEVSKVAMTAQQRAREKFHLAKTNAQIQQHLQKRLAESF